MLRPQDTDTRERKSLNGLWAFAIDPNGQGRAGRWFAGPLAGAREMAVPASFNDIAADPAVRDHVGEVWYQTTVRVPRGWAGQRIALYFESATHRATVWVNDTEVVSHEGGYTPFEADLTDHVRAGDQIRITVAVDNTLSFQSIPPGVVEDTPVGKRQRFHDFTTATPLWTATTRASAYSREVHAQAIREHVARDKNHPSVVLWSIANEPESDTEGAEDYFRPLFDLTRELDPTPSGGLRQRHARPVR